MLLVFSMNTLLGFACALGLKMGYNNHHHEEAKATATCQHQQLNHNKPFGHSQQVTNSNQHPKTKDDCCSHSVTSFNLLDKAPAHTSSIVHPVFATAFALSYYTRSVLPKLSIPKNIRAFAQTYHPPIPDIRVAIQSFQI